MKRFAIFMHHICTADAEGKIPLNSRAACRFYEGDEKLLAELIAQANLAVDLQAALTEQRKDDSIQRAFQKYHFEIGTP
jgi:hypothetical protein